MIEAISYKIFLDKVTKHLLRVECNIQHPDENGQIISLPAWVPGSYMIRDFGKHVVSIRAHANEIPISLSKIAKNTWQCAPCNGPIVVEYEVYCFDLAARGAYVDHTRVFFDGCRVFLVVEGEEEQTRSVEIIRSEHAEAASWGCATSMTRYAVSDDGFGIYVANNHLELIDHPFEISAFKRLEFVVASVPHILIVAGAVHADLQRLVDDVTKICQSHVDFFGELPKMDRYVFILSVLSKGWGGIEHRASSSLVCTRSCLPRFGDPDSSDDYKALLGLFSHEYFHLWNVKRIKPEVFTNPNLQSEVYTRQLWIFEGITAYFDSLNLVRAGVISTQDYLNIIQNDINQLLQTPGAQVQTLEESSFDAWIKYYQPDENSVNSSISYYIKGSIVALLLDLAIIKNSRRKQSLADIMQVLWQQYGKTGLGLPENYFEHVTFEVTGEDYSEFFEVSLRTTSPLELAEQFRSMGVEYRAKNAAVLDNLGIKINQDPNKLTIRSVITDSAAERAGLAANDQIIAVNSFAVNCNTLETVITGYKVNDPLRMHIFRNDVLMELLILNPEIQCPICELSFNTNLDVNQQLNLQKWLGA
jgi:predicted metalloprotease with PDZ domain